MSTIKEAIVAAAKANTFNEHSINPQGQYAEEVESLLLDFADAIFEEMHRSCVIGYVTADAQFVSVSSKRKDIKPVAIIPEV